MTFEQKLIFEKMENIIGYLKELKDVLKFSDQEILSDFMKFYTEERLFHLAVEAMLDINQHIIREKELKGYKGDLQGTFYVLGDNKILPSDFAFKIAPIAGVRNRLVHDYGSFDKELFTKNLREHFSDLEEYLKHINDFLDKGNIK
jgi:uncharacterized protein YutE (UPF0331/DUF86 family)